MSAQRPQDNVKNVTPSPQKQKHEWKSSYQEKDIVVFHGVDVHLFGRLKFRDVDHATEYLDEADRCIAAHPRRKLSAAIRMRTIAARKALASGSLAAALPILSELPHLLAPYERASKGGKTSSSTRWAGNEAKYTKLRSWFEHHARHSTEWYGQIVSIAVGKFPTLSRNTILKHTKDLTPLCAPKPQNRQS